MPLSDDDKFHAYATYCRAWGLSRSGRMLDAQDANWLVPGLDSMASTSLHSLTFALGIRDGRTADPVIRTKAQVMADITSLIGLP